jgi:hypothetical protein
LTLALLLALAPLGAAAPQPDLPTSEEGTYLGILFSAVPAARYAQLPNLPRNRGVLITHVLPDSPAAAADLQRDDVLVGYDAEQIRDGEHLARLIRADKVGRKVKLTFLRAGREMTAAVTLASGPMLQLAPAVKAAGQEAEVPRSAAKQGSPPVVSVAATPLADGNVRLTIEYYQEHTGRVRKVTCSGSPAEIDRELQRLPARIQDLTRVALDRMRALELHKGVRSTSSAPVKQR